MTIPLRSVILSSRDHTCINPMVENLPNKNEACKELLDTMNQMVNKISKVDFSFLLVNLVN